MNITLAGKVAIITGASSGIGLAIARAGLLLVALGGISVLHAGSGGSAS